MIGFSRQHHNHIRRLAEHPPPAFCRHCGKTDQMPDESARRQNPDSALLHQSSINHSRRSVPNRISIVSLSNPCDRKPPDPSMLKLRFFPSILFILGSFMTTYSAADTFVDQLKSKIQQRQARIGIIGLGYVGLAAGPAIQRAEISGHRLRHRRAQSGHTREGRLLHLPHHRRRDPGSRGSGLLRHFGLFTALRPWTPSSSAYQRRSTNITSPT